MHGRAFDRQGLPRCGDVRAPIPDSASAARRKCADREANTGVRPCNGEKRTAPPMRPQRELSSTTAKSTSKSTVMFIVFSPACALQEAAVYPARIRSAPGGAFVYSLRGVCSFSGDSPRRSALGRASTRRRTCAGRCSAKARSKVGQRNVPTRDAGAELPRDRRFVIPHRPFRKESLRGASAGCSLSSLQIQKVY